MHRVVVTGMSMLTPIGADWPGISTRLRNGDTAVRYFPEWEVYADLGARMAAPAEFEKPAHYTRKQTRSMDRVAIMATRISELALEDAGLLDDDTIRDGDMGISYGSSSGSTDATRDFGHMLMAQDTSKLNANSYLKMMSHTAAVNIGVFFGLKGRIVPTSSACTSGSQGIGYAYEAIKYGQQKMMLAGGVESLCPTQIAVFDTMYATSTRNDQPESNPRPFDRDRDGLVIGEGAGSLILEEREHALARGAHIHAEIIGFGTNSDGAHVTQPNSENMQAAMQLALSDADCAKERIGYVSAHGTATDRGDIAETHATARLLGNDTPISALKSYTGHTLGACGAIEAITAIKMMHDGWFHGTANLTHPDPECAELDYLRGEGRHFDVDCVMSNNFAFGGINTSLIFSAG